MIPRGRRVREITAAELRQYLDLKPDGGCKLNRRIYTDPDIFELEMEAIWERSWVYLGHESQLRNKGDFLTTRSVANLWSSAAISRGGSPPS
jgi:hypothetical protein